jgi:hypothetical protein
VSRQEDRLKRIAEEGWDRFAPISETNKRCAFRIAAAHPPPPRGFRGMSNLMPVGRANMGDVCGEGGPGCLGGASPLVGSSWGI